MISSAALSAPLNKRLRRNWRALSRRAAPYVLVLATLPLAEPVMAEREAPLAHVFSRKTGDALERRATVERAEQAASAQAPERQTVVVSPNEIERVLRTALGSVNSGRTEILVRTGDWERLSWSPEDTDAASMFKRKRGDRAAMKKTAAHNAAESSKKLVANDRDAQPAQASTSNREAPRRDVLSVELRPAAFSN